MQALNATLHEQRSIEIPMPLTHEELGSMCGLSRETVTRLLTRFAKEEVSSHSTLEAC
ncbi:MAG: helix-turn-helix domain-containing protein [Acidobacteriaceae bacterium]|nr:helix-turn-helix domain-containing protein [Acidobacteriaceae bacterium]